MILGRVRNGLVETTHEVAAVAVGAEGVVASSGDAGGRQFYFRSAIKPLQVWVSRRSGADLTPEQTALGSASHRGEPVHIAYVEEMLDQVGLDVDALLCPPDRPAGAAADVLWASRGRTEPERVFHNCSGKHAAMLRACIANDWPLDYRPADHPLQQRIIELASDACGASCYPTGVDGCGIPTLRGDVTALARAFLRVVTDPDAGEVTSALMRFPALMAGEGRPGPGIATWLPTVVKGGAEGCIGIGWPEQGLAFAAKAWAGDYSVAAAGVLALVGAMGLLPAYSTSRLDEIAHPSVLGGGRPQGRLEVLEM